MTTRKRCNFNLPKPFVVLSTKGLKRNNYRRYVIYPDLSKFKKACLNCDYRRTVKKRSHCRIHDGDFMLKFYGINPKKKKGIFISLGSIPLDLKPRPLAVRIEAYISKHRRKSEKTRGLRT